MNFSSALFLFLFLPAVLGIHQLLPGLKLRNAWLLLASLAFYAWGEPAFVLLLMVSTLMNYALGLWVHHSKSLSRRKTATTIAVVFNLALLAFFKYTNFSVNLLNHVLPRFGVHPIPQTDILLPIGISFFTFHALSYIIDVYRRKWPASTDPTHVALYIFFFPQLIAGPILRWSAIAPQIRERRQSLAEFAEGIRRFVGGLAKKLLLANTLAVPADQIFALSPGERSTVDAWIGIICYTLQIYFDFSGYSDMAVGLGKMFGFKFLENFEFPYLARSVKDFWRRWHISLSTWFRDYLYIPLGGSRESAARTHLNLVLVFLLCGLWHGASLTFVVWGLYHGLFLVLERTRWGALLEKLPQTVQHFYALVVVMMGWVLFRAETFASAASYFLALFGMIRPTDPQPYLQYATYQVLTAILCGIFFSGPVWANVRHFCSKAVLAVPADFRSRLEMAGVAVEAGLVVGLLLLSAIWLAGGTYNPFIYYRF